MLPINLNGVGPGVRRVGSDAADSHGIAKMVSPAVVYRNGGGQPNGGAVLRR